MQVRIYKSYGFRKSSKLKIFNWRKMDGSSPFSFFISIKAFTFGRFHLMIQARIHVIKGQDCAHVCLVGTSTRLGHDWPYIRFELQFPPFICLSPFQSSAEETKSKRTSSVFFLSFDLSSISLLSQIFLQPSIEVRFRDLFIRLQFIYVSLIPPKFRGFRSFDWTRRVLEVD